MGFHDTLDARTRLSAARQSVASPTQGSGARAAMLGLFNYRDSGEDDAQLGACASVSLMTEKLWTVFDELLCADSKWHRYR